MSFFRRISLCLFIISLCAGFGSHRGLLAEEAAVETPEPDSSDADSAAQKTTAAVSKKVDETGRQVSVVVVASKLGIDPRKTGVSLTVISAQDKETNVDNHAAEMLRMVPGVVIQEAGRRGDFTDIRTRGGEVDHTLMMYDGFKVNRHAQARQFVFDGLDPIGLERLEIARGPASVLFGSDAVTGAIDLVTRKGEGDPLLTVSAAGGSYQTDQETLSIEGRHGKFSYNAGGSRFNRFRAMPRNSYLESYNYYGRFDWDFNEDQALKLIVRGSEFIKGWYEHTGSFFGTAVDAPDPNDKIRNRDYLTGLEYRHRVVPIWETVARVGYFGADQRNISVAPNVPDPFFNFPNALGRTQVQERRFSFEWRNHVTAYEDENIRYVATLGTYIENEYQDQELTATIFGVEAQDDFTDYSVFMEHRLELFERAFLTLTGRVEDDEVFGIVETGRADAAILIPESDTRIFGSVGNAFRAPSFSELNFPFFGNPDLKPEKNFAYDVGIEQRFWDRRIMLSATWFHNQFKNLIAADASFVNQNIATATTRGFELQFAFEPIRQVSVMANATLMASWDDMGRRLVRRPPRTITGRVVVRPLIDLVPASLDGLEISVEGLHVSNRLDVTIDPNGVIIPRARNPRYTRFDLAVNYRFLEHFRAFARIQNFTDEKYEDVMTFPADGSHALAGLEFNWRF